jgi:hypothetical protein
MNSMMSDRLNEAAAAVATWRDRVRTLNENIANAESVAAVSVRSRQENVLAASLGDSAAKENLSAVLEDDRRAERELQDLRLALPLAESELRTAEDTHRCAEIEFRRAEVVRVASDRVTAAAAIDQAFSDFAAAWSDYESLGRELLNVASYDGNALYLSETVDGVGRLVAALPAAPFLQIRERYPFMTISTSKSLAASEAQYWRLSPPIEEVKAA